MPELKQANIQQLQGNRKAEHGKFEYTRKKFVAWGQGKQCAVSVYEIPPGKAAYPYHYHTMNEEVFYILSGEGILRTPEGERSVTAGDLLFFPADVNGAHKLINPSETQTLTYIDFDTVNELDVAVYPDSGKIGVWGKGINRIYRMDGDTDYYDGE